MVQRLQHDGKAFIFNLFKLRYRSVLFVREQTKNNKLNIYSYFHRITGSHVRDLNPCTLAHFSEFVSDYTFPESKTFRRGNSSDPVIQELRLTVLPQLRVPFNWPYFTSSPLGEPRVADSYL
jgi:hypothetical protein